jgi:hypothetical protein
LVVLVGIAGVVVATRILGGSEEISPRDHQPNGGYAGPPEPAHCGGELTTLDAELTRSKGYVILIPDTRVASSENLIATYQCPTGTRFEFGSGLSVYLSETDISDPATAWKKAAEAAPEIYSVTEVRGYPAWIADPARDPSGVADGGVVAVMEDGTYVAVIGNGDIPLDDLISTAESLERAETVGLIQGTIRAAARG